MADEQGVLPRYVIVSGPPAAGKSTLARRLATHLDRPLIAKDTIKDAILGALGARDVQASREIGSAAVAAMVAVAREAPAAVLESVWHVTRARETLSQLDGTIVEVFCRCDRQTLVTRYRARAQTRAAGHFDSQRTEAELWNDETCEPVGGGWRVIEVDTSGPVDLSTVVAALRVTSYGRQ